MGPWLGGSRGQSPNEDVCHAPSSSTHVQLGVKYDYITTGRGWRQSQDAVVSTKPEERLVCSTEVSMEAGLGRKSANVGKKSRVPKVVTKPRPHVEWNSAPRIAAKPQKNWPRPHHVSNHGYDDDASYVVTEANTETRKNRSSGSPLTPRGETTPLSLTEGTQRDMTPRLRPLTPREGKGGKSLPLTPREGPLTSMEGPLTPGPREGPLIPKEGKRKSLPLPPRNKLLTPREGKGGSRAALLPLKGMERSEM